eukprot:COSAG01_NODE_9539_length_2415_cov_1.990069_2_plen_78_part_00
MAIGVLLAYLGTAGPNWRKPPTSRMAMSIIIGAYWVWVRVRCLLIDQAQVMRAILVCVYMVRSWYSVFFFFLSVISC